MNIDLISPKSFSDGHPHDQYAWLRKNAPVYWHDEPEGPGFWVLSCYDDVLATGRHHQAFSSGPTIMMQDPPPGSQEMMGDYQMMLMMDPPKHTAFRTLVRGEFAKEPAGRMQSRISELATQIVDEVIEQGECDFVNDIAGEMPSFVIAEMMGLPLADGRELYKLTETLHTSPEALLEGEAETALGQMFGYASNVIQQKRKQPGDDLASKLLAAEVEGRKLDDLEFQLFFMLLVDAGGDTTRNLVASGMLALLDNPNQLAWLKEDIDARMPSAREELLRWCSPVVYMRRTAKQNTTVGDQSIKEGDKVIMYYGSANRDAKRFDAPDQLILGRSANHHLAFGGGGHVCLGQHIARIEIDAMLREVVLRMDKLQCTQAPIWLESNFISGPKTMPVAFAPSDRRGPQS